MDSQPTPNGDGQDVTKAVQQDLHERAEVGRKKYGERLQPNNGRDALQDAYEESLDLSLYLKQQLMEREQ